MDTAAIVKLGRYYLSKNTDESLDYLTQVRGLTTEEINKFELGYLPIKAVTPYPMLHGRILYPIQDAFGEYVSISGRVTPWMSSPAKYWHFSYEKGDHWYNLNRAKYAIIEAGYAIVVEGQMDVIALSQIGVYNVIATQGGGISDTRIALLLRYANKVLLVPDKDKAGAKIYKQLRDMFGDFRIDMQRYLVVGYKDIDELAHSGKPYEQIAALLKWREETTINIEELKNRVATLNQPEKERVVLF